jgi:hypothetical protein
MCKELKRLVQLSECVHLNKTDRDSLVWAIQNLSPEKPETETSFGGWDFSTWPSVPDKKVFAELIKARKAKKSVIMTQAYIDDASLHLHELLGYGLTVNESLKHAVIGGWQGFKASWIIKELQSNTSVGDSSISAESDVLSLLKQHKLTSIDQIPSSIKKEMKNKYLYRHYGPQTMIQLKNIGF